ncbi:MAG: DUF3842 family protein [Lachnospiraceae bacterium]
MRIMVMDGQGGGVGRSLLEALKERFPEAELIAVGTNATATANMMKSGVTSGATGENAVVYNSKRADVIVGPVGIVMADAMLGEITPTMAAAVASNDAKLILIPMSKCHATIVGVESRRLGNTLRRLWMRSLRTVSELTEELRVLPTGMRIIAIDGRCAAGKTTLAARLAKELGGDVIHMDDFFCRLTLRTQERRSEPGGNVHYERILF